MNRLQTVTTMFLLVGFLAQKPANAAENAISILEQVNEVAGWFTGKFNNAEQVNSNPSVPLLTLSTCPVELANSNEPSGTQNLYLEQPEINRFRLYSFEPGNNNVNLSIRSFLNAGSLMGICQKPLASRIVPQNNLSSFACTLMLFQQTNSYTGSNAPTGCPTQSGGKVVSSVTFQPDSTLSLDQIFSSTGQLIVATPIEFRRVQAVPEPTMLTGLVMAGFYFTWLRRKRLSSDRPLRYGLLFHPEAPKIHPSPNITPAKLS